MEMTDRTGNTRSETLVLRGGRCEADVVDEGGVEELLLPSTPVAFVTIPIELDRLLWRKIGRSPRGELKAPKSCGLVGVSSEGGGSIAPAADVER